MIDNKLTVIDLFSGIGGFSAGLEQTGGFETVAFCEIDPFCQKILAKHWPNIPIYSDVRKLTDDRLRQDSIAADVVTGGFPCQDISVAGRLAGIAGARSGLWSELCRIIGEVRPRYAIVENVKNLLSGPSEQRGGWFGRVLGDLAAIGYDAEWHCIPASVVGAQQSRDRVWVIAYPSGERVQGLVTAGDISEVGSWGPRGKEDLLAFANSPFEPGPGWPQPLIRGDDGRVPNWMDRIASLGNSAHPKVVQVIGRAILRAELTYRLQCGSVEG